MPGAGKLSPEQLRGASQTSCGVLNKLGPQIQWVESYVTDDKIYCVYIAPNEQAIRENMPFGWGGLATQTVKAMMGRRLASQLQARRDLEDLLRKRDSLVVRAPFRGRLASLPITEGQRVAEGSLIATVAERPEGVGLVDHSSIWDYDRALDPVIGHGSPQSNVYAFRASYSSNKESDASESGLREKNWWRSSRSPSVFSNMNTLRRPPSSAFSTPRKGTAAAFRKAANLMSEVLNV